ncbi:MAG: CRTAC1 family protein, partial [Gammaproteobacteria bacterium]|nr:CRTAC1 family protein [Gammaproteobacteria bacterium]
TVEANAGITTGNSGVAVGDIDNDGWPDIFLSGSGFFGSTRPQSQTVLLHNQGPDENGVVSFVDIAPSANVPGDGTALSAAFGDINNDGFVDLFVTAQGHLGFRSPAEQHVDKLYLNNGDLTFTDITVSAGVDGDEGSCVTTFSHFNDDGFIDLFVGVCNEVQFRPTPWYVYVNNGDNTFTDVAPTTQLDLPGYWMSSAFGDIDNDGDFDIFSTNLGGSALHKLWRNNGDGTYVSIASDEMANNFWAWGATFADFDNDGFQDLFYGGEASAPFGRGGEGYLFWNNGDSRFTLDQEAWQPALEGKPGGANLANKGATGLGKADYDGDGFVDLLVMTAEVFREGETVDVGAVLLRNEGNGNNSVTISLEGDSDHPTAPSNRMAIGARIEIVDNNGMFQAREIWAGSSFVSSESQWPVFGLGTGVSADATVYWPSGRAEMFTGLNEGRRHHLVEGTGTTL